MNKLCESDPFDHDLYIDSLQSGQLNSLIEIMKQREIFYQAETHRMDDALVKLGLIDSNLKIKKECLDSVERLTCLQEKFGTKEATPNALMLSHADRLRKHSNYAAKLKICLKLYLNMNVEIAKRITRLSKQYEGARDKVEHIVMHSVVAEIKSTEMKINRYQLELAKLEKKYPWLKNDNYDLPKISKEIHLLMNLRQAKEELIKLMSAYHGLKPDMQEATEQLSQIKLECKELDKNLLNV